MFHHFSTLTPWLPLLLAAGLSLVSVTGLVRAALAEATTPATALCLVCHVEEGTNTPETVRATRRHEGVEYHFCSERCASRFEKDPAKYIAAAPAPDSTAAGGMLFPRFSTAPT